MNKVSTRHLNPAHDTLQGGGALLPRLRWIYAGFTLLLVLVLVFSTLESAPADFLNPSNFALLVGLITVAWLPRTGIVVLIGMTVANLIAGAPSESTLTLPASALMLSVHETPRRRLWLTVLVVLLIAEPLVLHTPWLIATLYGLLTLSLMAGALLLGEALRKADRAVEAADAQIASSAPSESVRSQERASLAEELTTLLEEELRFPPPLQAESATAPQLRTELEDSVRRARHSMHNLRMLVATLRGHEPHPQTASTVTISALEAVEDMLVGHGFPCELTGSLTPPLTREKAQVATEVIEATAQVFLRDAVPGSPVQLGMSLPNQQVLVEMSYAPQQPTPDESELQGPFRQIEQLGGTSRIDQVGDRRHIRVTIPLVTPQQMDDTQPRSPWPERAIRWLYSHRRALATVLLGGLLALQTFNTTLVFWAPLDDNPQAFLLGLVSIMLAIVFVWARRVGFALILSYCIVIGALRYPLDADVWLIMTLLIWAGLRLRGAQLAAAVSVLVLYAGARAWSQPEPVAELLALLELALPIVGLVLMVLTVQLVSESRSGELERLSRERRGVRAEERQALAGELHDVLAHHLSLIMLEGRAGITAQDTRQLQETYRRVHDHAQAALVDMQLVASLLREEPRDVEDAPTMLDPLRTAEALETTLTDQGFQCSLRADFDVERLDATARRTLTRVLREAVTNAIRYAAEGSTVSLRLFIALDAANVVVVSELPEQCQEDRSGLSTGKGLEGLAERVELTGGEFAWGPYEGLWVVHARVPLSNEHPALRPARRLP